MDPQRPGEPAPPGGVCWPPPKESQIGSRLSGDELYERCSLHVTPLVFCIFESSCQPKLSLGRLRTPACKYDSIRLQASILTSQSLVNCKTNDACKKPYKLHRIDSVQKAIQYASHCFATINRHIDRDYYPAITKPGDTSGSLCLLGLAALLSPRPLVSHLMMSPWPPGSVPRHLRGGGVWSCHLSPQQPSSWMLLVVLHSTQLWQ